MAQANILEVVGVTKTFGKGEGSLTALHSVTLKVKKGESIAVIGKSGSGKSTLMHIMALLDTPSEGSLTIDNQQADALETKQLNQIRNKMFGFVFQQFFLNANATVLDNVILPLKIAGMSVRERNRIGIDVLKNVELEEKAKNKANDLSGGQKQRVVIARALVNNPKVIFADEPTGNLDSTTGRMIENMLFRLNQDRGITLIIVTHDAELAKRCDRQVHLKDGHIIKESK